MFSKPFVPMAYCGCWILAFFGIVPAFAGPQSQLSNQAMAQLNQEAATLVNQPARVSAKSLMQGVKVGEASQVQITLLNSDNHPVPAAQDWQCRVDLRYPSGAFSSQTVWIKKGQSSAQFEFTSNQAGLVSVTVRPVSARARPDMTNVLIVPATSFKRRASTTRKSSRTFSSPDPLDRFLIRVPQASWQLLPAKLELGSARASGQELPGSPASDGASSRLHLSVNDAGSDYLADGKDAAVISAYYESPDGTPAPKDIHLWFTWNNGALNPRPLTIAKASFSGAALLTSNWPASVHIRFVNSNPSYNVAGDSEFDIRFVPAVRGVALVGPDKLSVVDNEPIMVVFFDAHGTPISPGKDWKIVLHSKHSKLRLAPETVVVKPDSPVGSALLFPVSLGTDTIEAVVSNYSPQPLSIIVTGWLVLLLCVAGGVAGGLAAYKKFQGSRLWRLFLGVLGGAVLCWLYVYLALPKVDLNIAHNTFSVFFVALIGGYMGTAALDFAVKRLGLSA